jgi:hypothetical protein
VDLFDLAAVERVESELNRITEKRAREAKDADAIEDLWAEQDRRERARSREANRQAWCDYHEHLHRLHLDLAADHADRRSRLLLEAGLNGRGGGPSGEAA